MTDPAVLEESLLDILRQRLPDQDTSGFTLADFVYAAGSPIDALLYSRLFWPELLEVDGAVLLRDGVEDEDDLARVRASVRERGPVETERRFNLRELSDLFGKGLAEIDDDHAEILLARLAEMWRGRLQQQFPGRPFTVEVLTADETGGDIGICFHQSGA
jgi:hypothetical protein